MKYVCMNYQECEYYEYIQTEDLKDSDNVIYCPNCNSLAILVSSDFNIKEILEDSVVFVLDD